MLFLLQVVWWNMPQGTAAMWGGMQRNAAMLAKNSGAWEARLSTRCSRYLLCRFALAHDCAGMGLSVKIGTRSLPVHSQGQHNKPRITMTYVVTESCIKCKHTDCVDVCPVDCFREGPNFLVIDPDECIDCTLCVAECPVEAIFAEDDVPDSQKDYTSLNAELAKIWKPIIEKKDAPADAEEWAKVKDKKHLLEK